ncbi:MAG: hypothetical protein JSU00_17340 [Acidobacteria bacterium]|nr:hypothetical protein [Acidobacteriota bacterium]
MAVAPPWRATTGSWENGSAAIARIHFIPPSFSLLRPPAVIQRASGNAVAITIDGKSQPIRCIGRDAWTALNNGAPSIRATGHSCLNRILHGRNGTGNASDTGTSNAVNAVLPTTTQLRILPTTAQIPRKLLNLNHHLFLANNSPLVNQSPFAP